VTSAKTEAGLNPYRFGKVTYTKIVDNFDVFPESIYTPLYDKRSWSNDRWKSGGAAGNSDLNRMTYFIDFGI
jgi:hypothetical protein